MIDLRLLNAWPLNQKAAKLLKSAGQTLHKQTQLAVRQLMLWGMDQVEIKLDVATLTDAYPNLETLLTAMPPRTMMAYLTKTDSGDEYQIDLDGMEPDEAAATLLQELILAMQSQPEKLAA